MLYKINSTVIKNPDWKSVSVSGVDGSFADNASVNRVNKKGEVFADFDKIVDGAEIEATLWVSPNGRNYLFPPKQASTGQFKRPMGAIKEAMKQKEASIEKFQDSKELSIKVSSTFRAAVDSAIAHYNKDKSDLSSLEDLFESYREYYWKNFNVEVTKYPPF